jgi:dephospho-CoA kinase
VRTALPEAFDGGEFDRKKAGRLLFSDTEKLKRYQDIVFPYISFAVVEIIFASDSRNILLDAPTLFQSKADDLCDGIIAVVADREVCLDRIVRRDSISKREAAMRLNNQPGIDFFRKNADYVIENNSTIQEFNDKIKGLINKIT